MASPLSSSDSSPLARGTAAVVRSVSRTLSGGAFSSASYPDASPTEMTPIRETSRDVAAESNRQLQERVQRELLASRLPMCIILTGLLLALLMLAFAATMLVLCIRAVIGSIDDFSLPCDQPLKFYMLVSLVLGSFGECIFGPLAALGLRSCCVDETRRAVCTLILRTLPGLAVLGWGVYMIEQADTCPKTNPSLYYSVRDYIIVQIVFTTCAISFAGLCALGGFYFLLALQRALDNSPGCADAVRKLPKVEANAKELLNEDGRPKECVICLSDFSAEGNGHVVRAPCVHHFHEECLATWCKNHLDCPLCRAPVGEPDPEAAQ